jgi:hypothetical protein
MVLFTFCLARSCPQEVEGFDCSAYSKSFFALPRDARIKAFDSYDLETQYHLYLCGGEVVHPAMVELADPLAAKGPEAADLLRGKIIQTKNDHVINEIVLVFRLMKRRETFDVASDSSLMESIRSKVGTMQNSGLRRVTLGFLREIEGKEELPPRNPRVGH